MFSANLICLSILLKSKFKAKIMLSKLCLKLVLRFVCWHQTDKLGAMWTFIQHMVAAFFVLYLYVYLYFYLPTFNVHPTGALSLFICFVFVFVFVFASIQHAWSQHLCDIDYNQAILMVKVLVIAYKWPDEAKMAHTHSVSKSSRV